MDQIYNSAKSRYAAFGVDTEEIFSFEVLQALRVEDPKPEPTDTSIEEYTGKG